MTRFCVGGDCVDPIRGHFEPKRIELPLNRIDILGGKMKIQLLADLRAYLLTVVSADIGQAQGIGQHRRFREGQRWKSIPEYPHMPAQQPIDCGADLAGCRSHRLRSSMIDRSRRSPTRDLGRCNRHSRSSKNDHYVHTLFHPDTPSNLELLIAECSNTLS